SPLTSPNDFTSTRSRIIQLCLELTSTVQKDCTVYEMEEKILEVRFSAMFQSEALNAVCEKTVQATSDPSKRETSCLEEVHITNIRPGEGLVGWQLKHLVEKMRTDSGSITLVLKKRPSGTLGIAAAPLKNLRWRPPLVQVLSPSSRLQAEVPDVQSLHAAPEHTTEQA
ncbi:hypothetical protein XENOCAPTIV_030048, partial [Xenoophorus captivus]